MRRWFLSYHSLDQALAERLKAAIERKDATSHVFFAPTHMRAGGSWTAQLAQEIAEANAFILLVGERVGPWQVLEYDEALDKWANSPSDFPLIVVLLEGQTAPGLPFLRRLHWIIAADPTSEKEIARIFDAISGRGASPGKLWRYTSPYRGLAAMEEKDSDYFFGRERETVDIISALAAEPDKLPLLIGNSGVGKSSLAQAGVLAALKRQAWPDSADENGKWPRAFDASRRWCFLTMRPGAEPIKALVEAFLETWQFDAGDPARIRQRNEWMELLLDHNKKTSLADLLNETGRRHKELNQTEPPAFFLYIDQGEELYATRTDEHQRRRFSEILVHGLVDRRLRALMSLRSDFLGALQGDEPLFDARRQIDVPPVREAQLLEVVNRPAALLSARFEPEVLSTNIAHRTAEESAKDSGALPLLSYLLEDMWTQMVKRGDGVLRLPAAAIELGRVLVERADAFLAHHPQSEEALRRLFTLKLADVREDGEPMRRRAPRSEFSDDEWRLVNELADHPNRLLITATSEAGQTYAEVAHETIFRRWEKLRDWIAAEREFLAWKTGLEAVRRAWQATPDNSKSEALLMGAALTQAQSCLAKRSEDLSVIDREFIDQSTMRENKARAQLRRAQALVNALLVGIILVLWGVSNEAYVKEKWNWYMTMRPYRVANFDPYVLKPRAERAMRPLASFRECAEDCPEMIVIPANSFLMGSPATEKGHLADEGPQHPVVLPRRFAVSKFDVTFADWHACVSVGGCPQEGRANEPWAWTAGRRTLPVTYVSWDDAQAYVSWLSRMIGKRYRLLTEAEWEYSARAGSTTAYFWSEEPFKPNAFGLHSMAGNVWQWVQDCYHDDYSGAPGDGSEWTREDCDRRVVRGGSFLVNREILRSALRSRNPTGSRIDDLGFRVGRTLLPP